MELIIGLKVQSSELLEGVPRERAKLTFLGARQRVCFLCGAVFLFP